MLSFHNDQTVKQKYVDRVKEHQLADEIIKGTYWEHGKGCAVGCTVHSQNHSAYETELGLPKWLARVEDRLFEGMSNADAKQFPLRFLESINVGSDLSGVESKFMVVVLEFSLKQFDNAEHPDCTKAIKDVIHFHKTGEGNIEELRQAAYSAAAYSAAAARAAASYTASYTARGAANAARAASDATARGAANAARADAADAAAARAAYDAAAIRQEAFKYLADQLIEILKETK